jgi:hypothetical protein
MTGSNFQYRRAFNLPLGYRVTFDWSGNALTTKWEPDVPAIRSSRSRHRFFRAYQAARADFLHDVATVIGGKVLVIDTNGAWAVIRPVCVND